jgi:hypothetical protein
MTEKEKIKKWDMVDNTIHEMINQLNPSKEPLEWNIKPISEIRQVLVSYFVEELKLCTEDDFYP